ncbi:MAG TPA: hypothetical protein PKA37_12175 [Planctomycetota bacterium]|nr:hypothetical protein [Planctomycetota bacterium]
MEFRSPEWLWLLLAALPLLWFLRRARSHKPVVLGTYMLLERAAQALPPMHAPRRPPWKSVLLFLPVVLIILLLARPTFPSSSRTIVLLDRSASMGTMHDGRSRMAQAQELLQQRGFSRENVMGVPAPAWAEDLFEATAAEGDLAGLMQHVAALRSGGARVTVVTDLQAPKGFAASHWIQVGRSAANRGLVAFGLSEDGSRGLVRVAGKEGWESLVRVAWMDRDLKVRDAIAEARMSAEVTEFRMEFAVPTSLRSAVLLATLSADDNPLDNEAYLVPEARDVLIRVAPTSDSTLLRAFAAHPLVRIVVDPLLAELHLDAPSTGKSKPLLFADPRSVVATRGSLHFVRPQGDKLLGDNLNLLVAVLPDHHRKQARVLARLHETPLLCDLGNAYWLAVPSIDPVWANDASFPLLIAALVDHHATSGAVGHHRRGPARMPEPLVGSSLLRTFGGEAIFIGKEKLRSESAFLELPGLYAPAPEPNAPELSVGISVLSETESSESSLNPGFDGFEPVPSQESDSPTFLPLCLALFLTCLALFRKRL